MLKNIIRKIYWILSAQFGIDPRRMFGSFKGIPRYVFDLVCFCKVYKGRLDILPCFNDWYREGGETHGEYFWQDLYVARQIFQANPSKHVDIGSRIDGFVAHIASYREIEIFDIRPVTSKIPGVIFRQADLMSESESFAGYSDSLSCLHTLEHFGLGRYGDPINPFGYESGLVNMAKILRSGGYFYLSVPIGQERVAFNAHRIFDPHLLIKLAESNGLILNKFAWVDNSGSVIESSDTELDINNLCKIHYTLGIFTFIKH